jgi:uncharacterized protein DUF3551
MSETKMKVIQLKPLMAALIAFAAVAFVTLSSPAADAGPLVPPGHACLEYDEGGTDCSFTSYGQCLQTASGIGAECYGSIARDDAYDRHAYGAGNGYRARHGEKPALE